MTGPRPWGVRIERADGETIPVELAYGGVDGDCTIWQIATVVDHERGDVIHVDVMPPHTAIAWRSIRSQHVAWREGREQ